MARRRVSETTKGVLQVLSRDRVKTMQCFSRVTLNALSVPPGSQSNKTIPNTVAGAHLLLGAKLKNMNFRGWERERAKAQQ